MATDLLQYIFQPRVFDGLTSVPQDQEATPARLPIKIPEVQLTFDEDQSGTIDLPVSSGAVAAPGIPGAVNTGKFLIVLVEDNTSDTNTTPTPITLVLNGGSAEVVDRLFVFTGDVSTLTFENSDTINTVRVRFWYAGLKA